MKLACPDLGRSCGTASDGCGGSVDCGSCPGQQVCLSNGTCCQPLTCNSRCDYAGPDGCGGFIQCPVCRPH
jgi:hypothetical protein